MKHFLKLNLCYKKRIIYVLAAPNGFPADAFLNRLLTGLETGGAGFLATAVFGFLSLYLLWV
jgi:hypothetical protein